MAKLKSDPQCSQLKYTFYYKNSWGRSTRIPEKDNLRSSSKKYTYAHIVPGKHSETAYTLLWKDHLKCLKST